MALLLMFLQILWLQDKFTVFLQKCSEMYIFNVEY